MKRFPVTVSRNDGRRAGFRRWTVYVGNVAAFDIEAGEVLAKQEHYRTAMVHVINSEGNSVAMFDGREYAAPEKATALARGARSSSEAKRN